MLIEMSYIRHQSSTGVLMSQLFLISEVTCLPIVIIVVSNANDENLIKFYMYLINCATSSYLQYFLG
jgi:hypothetical protein